MQLSGLLMLVSVFYATISVGLMLPGKTQNIEVNSIKTQRSTTCGTPSKLTAEQIKGAVDTHNQLRLQEQASNMMKIEWSDDLAAVAQAHTDKCTFQHNDARKDCDGNSIGENLYMGSGAVDMKEIVEYWHSEVKDWNSNTDSCNQGAECGHYTQVVWARSYKIGCGATQCGGMNEVVCNYYEVGNMQGQSVFTKGAHCSNCDSEKTGKPFKCENNLCVSCSGTSDPACKCGQALSCKNGGQWNTGTCSCDCTKDYYGSLCENSCSCADTEDYCQYITSYCNQPGYEEYMKGICMKTCGFPCNLPASCA